MNQIETANRFVSTMIDAESKITGVKNSINSKRESVEALLKRFEQEQQRLITEKGTVKLNKSAKALYDSYIGELMNTVNKNTQSFNEYLKGSEFIKKFEETFIVSVFGKVKSGKSYLGNYIMGNAFRSNNVKSGYDSIGKPTVTVYDRGKITTQDKLNEMQGDDGFGVDSIEATSTIQYFNIGGMTWFDTPGTGSITKENEDLANEYIKNSDLVVFCMNSDAAGTRQEIKELKELHDMGKPILLLVTQSDNVEEDWDDELEDIVQKHVPKTEKQRNDVEEYLRQTVRDMNMGDVLELGGGNVLTISTLLATEALKNNDEKLYEGSNIDKLLERLIDITNTDAAEMKLKNPKDRFNKLIDILIEKTDELKSGIETLNKQAAENEQKADIVKRQVIAEVRRKAYDVVSSEVARCRQGVSGGNKISGNTIAQNISGSINNIISDECMKGMEDLVPDIGSISISAASSDNITLEDMEEKKISKSYDIEVVKRRKVSRGAFGKITDVLFGEKYETYTTTQRKQMEFSIGDNSTAIESSLLDYVEELCRGTLDKMITDIINGCNEPLRRISRSFTVLAAKTQTELEGLKIK